MLKLFSFIFLSFFTTLSAFDFKGTWELDLDKTKAYAKKIGADSPKALKSKFHIHKNLIFIDKKKTFYFRRR